MVKKSDWLMREDNCLILMHVNYCVFCEQTHHGFLIVFVAFIFAHIAPFMFCFST